MKADRIKILMVCTGNICRSPMMERLMRDALRRRGVEQRFQVASAGTWGQVGEPMQPFAASTLVERGVDADGFVARAVGNELLTAADLILTATREHRSVVVGMAPSTVRRSFTLIELARVAAAAAPDPGLDDPARADPVDAERVRQSIAWAAQMRGTLPRPPEGVDDLADPLGAPQSVYRARADAIAEAVEQIVPFLIGARPASAPG